MPEIQPVPAVTYPANDSVDLSDRVAPPYDVLDEPSKNHLLQKNPDNIVAVDLPHLPPKTVGPDSAYEQAGQRYRQWLADGVLQRHDTPAVFVYQQTYTVADQTYQRRGLIANIPTQPFGKGPDGKGGIYQHEQTFSEAKEDRLKLMRATQAQLSPIFGLYSDPDQQVGQLLAQVVEHGAPTFHARTDNDGVLHELWPVRDPQHIDAFRHALAEKDVFIADGHHRYNTALNYKNERLQQGQDPGGAAHCLFVLVAIQDPGMIILPTHRVLGNMPRFDMNEFIALSEGTLRFTPVPGNDLNALEDALASHPGPHPIGLYNPAQPQAPLEIATTVSDDPLQNRFPDSSPAWRQLDVAIVQHLIVEQFCQPNFCEPGQSIRWKFPHTLQQLKTDADSSDYQLGLVLRPTPLEAVRQVSEAGELMPQKSTFFYPKLATGLVINPLD